MEKYLKLLKMSKNDDEKFVCSDNLRQYVWNKVEKSSRIEKDKKSLISAFACFLIAIAKV